MACLPKNKLPNSSGGATTATSPTGATNTSNITKIASADIDETDFNEVDISDDFIDPRVQIELEKLNSATDAINKLEVELDEARASFRQLLSESSQRINFLAKKLGACIEKARPYYEARMIAKEAHTETQKAALRFERANSAHAAAKEMVFLAEEGLQKEGRTFDPAWQEMLNHATMRVNEAERERTFSEQEHRLTSQTYNDAEQKVQQLQKDLKRAIAKSSLTTRRNLLQLNNLAYQHQLLLLPYFEMKAQFNQMMEEQKEQVQQLEEQILYVKQSYAHALHNLEEISDEIHQKRQQKQDHQELGSRDPGVGAESPVPSVPEKDGSNSDINAAINTDDVYLRLPRKLGPLYSSSLPSSDSFSKLNQISKSIQDSLDKKGIQQVDHGIQTDKIMQTSDPYTAEYSSEEKVQNERISAWVQESGIRNFLGNRKSLLNSRENNNHGLAATLFLNVHEDSDMSDAESLNSTDVLTDEQIASLMLDRELEDAYQDIIVGGTKPKENANPNMNQVETVLNSLIHRPDLSQHCNDVILEEPLAIPTDVVSQNINTVHSTNKDIEETREKDLSNSKGNGSVKSCTAINHLSTDVHSSQRETISKVQKKHFQEPAGDTIMDAKMMPDLDAHDQTMMTKSTHDVPAGKSAVTTSSSIDTGAENLHDPDPSTKELPEIKGHQYKRSK